MFDTAEIARERTAARREGLVTNAQGEHIARLLDEGRYCGPYSAERIRMLCEQHSFILRDALSRARELRETKELLEASEAAGDLIYDDLVRVSAELQRVTATAAPVVTAGAHRLDTDAEDDNGDDMADFDPYAPGIFDDPDADELDFDDDDLDDDDLDDDDLDDDDLDDEDDDKFGEPDEGESWRGDDPNAAEDDEDALDDELDDEDADEAETSLDVGHYRFIFTRDAVGLSPVSLRGAMSFASRLPVLH